MTDLDYNTPTIEDSAFHRFRNLCEALSKTYLSSDDKAELIYLHMRGIKYKDDLIC